jgi:hypothetical protein
MKDRTQASQPNPPSAPALPAVQFDTHGAVPVYANVFQASGSTEEIVLDFGLFDQRKPDGSPTVLPVSQRLVLSYPTARRLADFLNALLRRHDESHGPTAREPRNRPPTPRP